MSEATIQTLLQVLGGGVFGFLIAWYAAHQQKVKKHIAYKTSSIQLLHLHEETPDAIKVSVDKSVITGNKADSGIQEPIKNATAHSIVLKNKGNSTASDLYFEVEFEKSVNILAFFSTPSSSDAYKILLKKVSEKENTLSIFLPYLNPNEIVDVSIVATFDESPTKPVVTGRGKEVSIYKFARRASPAPVALLFFSLVFVVFAMFEGSVVTESMGSLFPESWIQFLGGTVDTVQVKVLSFPILHKVLTIILGGVLLGGLIYRLVVKNRF